MNQYRGKREAPRPEKEQHSAQWQEPRAKAGTKKSGGGWKQFVRRHKIPVIAVGAVLVLLLVIGGGVGIWWINNVKAPELPAINTGKGEQSGDGSGEVDDFNYIDVDEEMPEYISNQKKGVYTFLVLAPSEDVSGVTLRLGLGIYDADDEDKLVSGYAFFDAVSVRDIGGENEFGMAVENMPGEGEEGYGTFAQCRIPEEAEQGATDSEDDSATQAPSNSFNLDALWWMVPTIVIGLAIIAVVIVYFVRKYKKKFTKKSSDDPTDSVSASNVRKKKSDYDAFNE